MGTGRRIGDERVQRRSHEKPVEGQAVHGQRAVGLPRRVALRQDPRRRAVGDPHTVPDQKDDVLRSGLLRRRALKARRRPPEVKVGVRRRAARRGLRDPAVEDGDRQRFGAHGKGSQAVDPFAHAHGAGGRARDRRSRQRSGHGGGENASSRDAQLCVAERPVPNAGGRRVGDAGNRDVASVDGHAEARERGALSRRCRFDADVELLELQELGFVGGHDAHRDVLGRQSSGEGQCGEGQRDTGEAESWGHVRLLFNEIVSVALWLSSGRSARAKPESKVSEQAG